MKDVTSDRRVLDGSGCDPSVARRLAATRGHRRAMVSASALYFQLCLHCVYVFIYEVFSV